jgi:hypothetical protein
MAKGLTVNRILLCCRVPALCAACAVALLRWSGPRTEERSQSMSAAPPGAQQDGGMIECYRFPVQVTCGVNSRPNRDPLMVSIDISEVRFS